MRSTLVLLVITTLMLGGCVRSQPITGYWMGAMEMNGKTVDISADFTSGKGEFSSKDLMLLDESMNAVTCTNGTVSFSVTLDVRMVFEGKLENNSLDGTVSLQGGPPNVNIRFHLDRISEAAPEKLYSMERLIIHSTDVNLSAKIYSPKSSHLHPALVLLHGSSTNLKNHYAFEADYFAAMGFEVLIFDKRGNGASTGNNVTSRYSDLVDDAISCLETMKNRPSVDRAKIGLWGYSQGAMLLPRVCSKTTIPSFLIAKSPEVCGETEAAAFSDSLRVTNSGQSPANGHIAAESHRYVESMIRDGSDHRDVENFIRRNAQQHECMERTGLSGSVRVDKNAFEGWYWKGRTEKFLSYWNSINVPTLVIFGEDDEYIDAGKNEALIDRMNNRNITTKHFLRANHGLKKAFNPVKYPDVDWPRVIDGYPEFLRQWVENTVHPDK